MSHSCKFPYWDVSVRERGHQSFWEASLFSKPAVTQWFHIQRLSPEDKGGLPYIPFRSGYRNGGTVCPTHGHILFHWPFKPLVKGDPSLVLPQVLLDIPQIFFFFVSLLHSISHYPSLSLIISPPPHCLPATFPLLMLRPTSHSKSIVLIIVFVFP
jgi:hypothetical protein